MRSQVCSFELVMRALADPTRRAVFERIVGAHEINVGELTRASGVSQGAVSQHLGHLKRAGLIAERPQGRKVYYRAQPNGLVPLVDWLSRYDVFWHKRFDDLREPVKDIDP